MQRKSAPGKSQQPQRRNYYLPDYDKGEQRRKSLLKSLHCLKLDSAHGFEAPLHSLGKYVFTQRHRAPNTAPGT